MRKGDIWNNTAKANAEFLHPLPAIVGLLFEGWIQLGKDFLYCFEAAGSESKENIMLSYQELHSFSFESRPCIHLCSQLLNNLSNMCHTCCFSSLKGLILVAPLHTLISGLGLPYFYFRFYVCTLATMRQLQSLPMSLTDFFSGRNTQHFSQNKGKNSIITANSVIASQKVSTDLKQNQMNCQHST